MLGGSGGSAHSWIPFTLPGWEIRAPPSIARQGMEDQVLAQPHYPCWGNWSTCWLHWIGDGRSAALNNRLTSLSRGIRGLPSSTRQEMKDKLPAQKVRSLPSPSPRGRKDLQCHHWLLQQDRHIGRSNPNSAPAETLEVGGFFPLMFGGSRVGIAQIIFIVKLPLSWSVG